MIIDLQKLLAGIVATLERDVGPEVSPGRARSQFYSCLDLLNNLAAKLDWNRDLLAAEIESVEEALTAALPSIQRAAAADGSQHQRLAALAATIATLLEQREERASNLFPRRLRCNEILEQAIATVNDPDLLSAAEAQCRDLLAQAAEPLREHLRNQTLRDVMYLKPMMLSKISQG